MIAKKATIIIFILIISFLYPSCSRTIPSNVPTEPSSQQYEAEIKHLKEKLDNLETQYKMDEDKRERFKADIEQIEIVKKERELFREDIVEVFEGIEDGTLLGEETPIFIGFDKNNEMEKKHKEVIRDFLVQWKKDYIINEDILQEIKPVVCFLSVAPKKPVSTRISSEDSYYSVKFYHAAAAKIPHEKNGCIRGSFDGLSEWFLHLEEKDGKWRVVTFGPDS